ncbi:MAG: PKD domain-containing protein, partial [Chloroflexaceae bacterium]|nr:PKD domain-containing protein [Chloroflexaceae bacterium]
MIDGAGNSETSHFGPWYVGNTDLSTVCSARGQAITLDGFLDVANNEWTTSEFLDDDERAGQARMLYATWDADHFYIGWQGARWQIDGELIAYLDTQTGGSTSALSGAITLPFAADYAIVIEDEITGTLYEYDGSQWITSSLPWEFAHDSNNGGGTEIRLPFGAQVVSGAVQLLALELSDGAPIALFPTTNALTGPWNAAYIWSDLCATDDPGDGQPTALNATLNTGSVPGTKALVGPGSFIEYGISITNNETNQTLSSAQVNLTAATGLSFESITGITCSPAAACTAGENTWTINLPDVDPAETAQFSVTARLVADLTGIPQISTGIELEQAGSPLATATRTHATDSTAPTIALEDPATLSLQPGLQRIVGSADDGTGIGVAAVQVRPEGGTWQTITGTVLWEAVLNVPQVSTYSIDVRALDAFDNTGTPVRYDFTVDTISPTVSITLPATLRGGLVRLLGTATDPLPLGGAITDVEVQLGLETNEWLPAETPTLIAGTTNYRWSFLWDLPPIDGDEVPVRVRATDAAGNISLPTAWISTTVDTVFPVVTSTQPITTVFVSDYLAGSVEGTPVISGTVSDGYGVAAVQVEVFAPNGTSVVQSAQVVSNTWQFIPVLEEAVLGNFRLQVLVEDRAGNVTVGEAYELQVIERPLSTLQATNDGPTALGATTTLTASLATGSNVTYAWSLGDGTTATGATVSHTYPAVGIYTAIVTATNSVGTVSTTTTVIVDETVSTLQATNDGPTALGATTTLTASLATGSNTSYTWSLGDGTTATGATVSHTYPAVGIYTAIVTATNSVGTVSTTTTVVVDEAIAGLQLANDGPTALGATTTLTASLATGSNVTYAWSLGDGTTATGATVSHTYPAVGIYTA